MARCTLMQVEEGWATRSMGCPSRWSCQLHLSIPCRELVQEQEEHTGEAEEEEELDEPLVMTLRWRAPSSLPPSPLILLPLACFGCCSSFSFLGPPSGPDDWTCKQQQQQQQTTCTHSTLFDGTHSPSPFLPSLFALCFFVSLFLSLIAFFRS